MENLGHFFTLAPNDSKSAKSTEGKAHRANRRTASAPITNPVLHFATKSKIQPFSN
jgi:hypothetical protein